VRVLSAKLSNQLRGGGFLSLHTVDHYCSRRWAGRDWGGGILGMHIATWNGDPPTVKVNKAGAFLQCTHLTTAVLGEGLEEIGEAAFFECTSLHEITIPHSVKAIKESAFFKCTHIRLFG
jgi:hypothetical protein